MLSLRGKALTWILAGTIACLASVATAQINLAEDERAAIGAYNNYSTLDSEQLLQRAMSALEAKDFRSAEQAVSDALQIIKVNYGLRSTLQFDALQIMAQALIAQSKWQNLDQNLAYFEWLLRTMWNTDFDAYLVGAKIVNRIYLHAAAEPRNPHSAHYLISAKQLNWRAVSVLEQKHGKNNQLLAPWLYNIVLTHYYQSTLIRRKGMTSFDYKSETPEIVNGWSLSKNESVQQSYNIGIELLHRIRDLFVDSNSPTTDALMLTYLADWELLFDNGNEALTYYRQANHQLQTANSENGTATNWFSRPVVIPAAEFTSQWQAHDGIPDPALTFVAFSPLFPGASTPQWLTENLSPTATRYTAIANFDLIAKGVAANDSDSGTKYSEQASDAGKFSYRVQNLTIEAMRPSLEVVTQTAKNQIGNLQFRPLIQNNVVSSWNNVRLEYVYFLESELQESAAGL